MIRVVVATTVYKLPCSHVTLLVCTRQKRNKSLKRRSVPEFLPNTVTDFNSLVFVYFYWTKTHGLVRPLQIKANFRSLFSTHTLLAERHEEAGSQLNITYLFRLLPLIYKATAEGRPRKSSPFLDSTDDLLRPQRRSGSVTT
jgi:hypothetical protein